MTIYSVSIVAEQYADFFSIYSDLISLQLHVHAPCLTLCSSYFKEQYNLIAALSSWFGVTMSS